MEPGRVLDLDRRRERSGKQAGKIRRVFSGVFRGAVRGGGRLQHTGRQEARTDKSTRGGRPQVDRQTAGPAAHDRTGGGLWHRAGERAKTGRQGDGQPHREGFYAPGIVSWELDIYAPHSPPTGRKLTASTSTGKEQGNSLQPTGQLYSPPQATSQQAQATDNRERASRSQQQGHSLQLLATQHKPQPTANSGQRDGQPARRHQNARARFQPNAPAPESRRARARVGTPGGPGKVAGAEAQNFFRYEGIFFTFPALAEKIEGGQKNGAGRARGGKILNFCE